MQTAFIAPSSSLSKVKGGNGLTQLNQPQLSAKNTSQASQKLLIKSQMTKINQESSVQKSTVKNEPFFFAHEKKSVTPIAAKASKINYQRDISVRDAKMERLNMIQGFNPSKYLNSQLSQMAARMKI